MVLLVERRALIKYVPRSSVKSPLDLGSCFRNILKNSFALLKDERADFMDVKYPPPLFWRGDFLYSFLIHLSELRCDELLRPTYSRRASTRAENDYKRDDAQLQGIS
jgi:hypothetical protein